ncbi:acyl-CoA thioesterase [Jeotgalibacillus sp. R-1-5s-1]|uniref:acyl-CoA thioesterase n=1 Tax=Jeotgalibacillus sp. R-1-5s-1 TaxID=2555897 RepID=UPI00106D83C6|nr:acyl-CoA thioesterase [Jeotgalibacillus sp. R-1-5s-1]TFE01215.1 acyl-CoA thioesterase [Jeotgalibacillus sp. R-1-5s-1]
MTEKKFMSETRTIQTSNVLPPDTNHHGTLFGGKLMAYIDNVASIAAIKLARKPVVTASTDSVDFLKPIRVGDAVTLEAFVSYTGTSSMEVFVRVTSEKLLTGEQAVAAISFLTFVALGEDGKPARVPQIVPETEEEVWLNETAENRAAHRKARKMHSQELASFFSPDALKKKNNT